MFDRTTGAVDPAVIAYWKEHYDVVELLRRHWPELKGDLDGKIHLTVGSADTFYLDGSAHLLEATMKGLGARTDFRYVEGRGHFDLYTVGDGLLEEMRRLKGKIWKMLEVAEEAGDPIAFTALVRELRQIIGGYFELADVRRQSKFQPAKSRLSKCSKQESGLNECFGWRSPMPKRLSAMTPNEPSMRRPLAFPPRHYNSRPNDSPSTPEPIIPDTRKF